MISRTVIETSWHRGLAALALVFLGVVGLNSGAAAATAEEALGRGRDLLAAGQAAEAKQAFEAALAADPSSVEAHLGLARSYYALGEYARAVVEFESVLRFDNLPRDLQSQAETYDRLAAGYVTRGWSPFFYGETGIGNYRQNNTDSTDIFGGGGNHDTFLPIRVGGGWSTALTERHSFNGTLDYRFRWYDDSDRRNDSDLRWNFNLSRPVDDDSLRFGMRGRASYRGDGQYRNDWGVFATYDLGFGPNDRLTLGGELRERRYPRGPLRNRTRDIAEFTASWAHSLANGRSGFGLGGSFGQEWASRERIDGDATFWGINGEFDHSFSDTLDLFLWVAYANENFDEERPDFTTDPDLLLERTDDLWYAGGGLVWRFAPGWSLRPTFEYDWEDSNIPALTYSKTEFWLTVRASF
jgi:tetratricopeptide (TPR) repeat protein